MDNRQSTNEEFITIHSNISDYDVIFHKSDNFISELIATPNALFVIDSNVYNLYTHLFETIHLDRCIIVDAIETNKVIDTSLRICEKLTNIPAKKNATLISIGGGIIQDITGFVANITYRGINWIFVPTTLLAACDSCIGAKNSLNYKGYKNLLGTFYPPCKIDIYPGFFSTLTDSDFKSGLGEVIKFNIMSGKLGLANIEDNIDKLLLRDPEMTVRFVMQSLLYKKNFVEIDEFDKGERKKLNFAHTFGHAMETVSNYSIPHGIAVAIGMLMANCISYDRNLMPIEIRERIENVLIRVIDIDASNLRFSIVDYVDAIRKDKKQINTSITAVLLQVIESGDMRLNIVNDITEEEIKCAINHLFERLKR